eukprot:GHVU01111984.1.p1 GENE.GHVU01111984.1~~GHVU01111984.1.p1  ORF type:complete len:200 (+),score=26.10 GHVU01111984.1:37-636(+)
MDNLYRADLKGFSKAKIDSVAAATVKKLVPLCRKLSEKGHFPWIKVNLTERDGEINGEGMWCVPCSEKDYLIAESEKPEDLGKSFACYLDVWPASWSLEPGEKVHARNNGKFRQCAYIKDNPGAVFQPERLKKANMENLAANFRAKTGREPTKEILEAANKLDRERGMYFDHVLSYTMFEFRSRTSSLLDIMTAGVGRR